MNKKDIIKEEIEAIAKQMGLKPIPLNDLIKSIIIGHHEKSGKYFQDENNAIYLPRILNKNAMISLKNLELKQENYFQLIITSKEYTPRQIAAFFNSELGMKVRKLFSKGEVIPLISKKDLLSATIYL